MKMYPDSKLPLKPEGRLERYLLLTFENTQRGLGGQAASFFVMLGLWALTQWWGFGLFAALGVIRFYSGLEGRAVSRMIRRESSLEHNHVA